MVVRFLAMTTLVAVVGIRIAVFIAVSVLGVLSVCIVLISVAVVLSQKRCSSKEEQGGKQGLE